MATQNADGTPDWHGWPDRFSDLDSTQSIFNPTSGLPSRTCPARSTFGLASIVREATTKPIERSHIATRDRLRASRGLKTTATGQRFLDGFEAMHAQRTRAVAAAMATLAAGLIKAA